MTKSKIVLLGGGGHCKSVIDVIRLENKYNILGILDVPEKIDQSLLGVPFIGTDEIIPELAEQFNYFVITLGHLGFPTRRKELFTSVLKYNGELPVIISPSAYVSRDSKIGMGSVIFHSSVINASVTVGVNSIINTGSIVDHDSIIGDDVHISTRTVINGQCDVGDMSFVGSGAVVSHNVSIGKNNIIGAGSVVLKDTNDNSIYAGAPATFRKKFS